MYDKQSQEDNKKQENIMKWVSPMVKSCSLNYFM